MVHAFPKGTSPKISALELELPYYDAAVQYVNTYATNFSVTKLFSLSVTMNKK